MDRRTDGGDYNIPDAFLKKCGDNYPVGKVLNIIWTRERGGSVVEFDWRMRGCSSTLDKQRICVNTQLKSSKKQLKRIVYVPKSNSNDRYAITCDVIAYHLVHFISIWVINKCQSGIDFFFY